MKRAALIQNKNLKSPLRSLLLKLAAIAACVSARVSFLFILFSLLFASCPEPLPLFQQEQIPAGKGAVTIRIVGTDGRTILPDDEIHSITDFDRIELVFCRVDGGTNIPVRTLEWDTDKSSDTFYLEPDTYFIIFTGYVNDDPLAAARTENFTLTGSNSVTRTVTLRAIADSGTGTFAWDIDFPANATMVRMKISPIAPGVDIEIDIVGGSSNELKISSMNLSSGFYYFTTYVDIPGAIEQAVRFGILHIYQNRTSTFRFGFTDEHFKIAFAGTETNLFLIIEIRDMEEWENIVPPTQTVVQGQTAPLQVELAYQTGYTYLWYLDGVSAGTGSTYTFNQSQLGIYEVVVVVTRTADGQSRSGRVNVMVLR